MAASSTSSASSTSETPIDITSIKPFKQEHIRVVPGYLFETYYKARKSYDPEYLVLLRLKANKITLSEIRGYEIDEAQKVKRAQEFDWVYGLDRLEEEFLKEHPAFQITALKVEDLIRMNSYFSRFICKKRLRDKTIKDSFPGQLRNEMIRFNTTNFTPTETIALIFIEEKIRKSLSRVKLSSISDPSIKVNSIYVSKQWLKNRLLHHIKTTLAPRVSSKTFSSGDSSASSSSSTFGINIDMVDNWATNNQIDLIAWLRKRMHYLPDPSQIKPKLQGVLNMINSSNMHPIEKAAKILFEIAKIRVFEDANIETGVAIASAILLYHGYLPPIIEDKDYEKFTECINKHLKEANGHIHLMNLIAKLVQETQEKFNGDTRDISKFSFDEKK